jgi:YegS/Rv2252/BmrU family lipid kinase
MPNYLFIVNPQAARGKAGRISDDLKKNCRERGLDFDMVLTKDPGHATELAARGAESFDSVVVVGGDGTVNETVNGLVGTTTKFGIIPVGSGNDFVRVMGIPMQMSAALDVVEQAKTRKVDLGKAGTRYFNNGLGIGFDAWVVQESLGVKYLRGNLIYLTSVLKTVFKYRPPMTHLTYNDVVRDERLFMITVGNGTSMGGGFKLTPNAIVDDGLLDLNIICDLTKMKVFKNLLGVYSGNHIYMPEVTTGRTTNLSIQSDEGFAAHVDGELLALDLNSLEVQIVPKALEVIVPENQQ